MNLERYPEYPVLLLPCMNHTDVEIIFHTPMLDGIIDEFIGNKYKSSSPWRMNVMYIKNSPDNISDYFRLTMIGVEFYRTINMRNILNIFEYIFYGFIIIFMCDIEFNHEEIGE